MYKRVVIYRLHDALTSFFFFLTLCHMASLISSERLLHRFFFLPPSLHVFTSPRPLSAPLGGMMRRMRSRSRTICLSLAFVAVFLYLLLALVSLPIHHQPCDPLLPPRTHVLRDLARASYTSVGLSGPTDATHGDSSNKGANKGAKGHVRALSDGLLSATEGKMNMPGGERRHGTDRAESVASGQSKLEALFDHPLYNMPSPPIPEEDWLLKVKPKIKASEKSSQMWSVYTILQFHVQKGLFVCERFLLSHSVTIKQKKNHTFL